MLAKKWATRLMMGILGIGSYSLMAAEETRSSNQQADNVPFNLHREIDDTDTYAIQLDSSEEEQDEELADLENLSKKNTKGTPATSK